jgi:hypothetical protein
MQLPIIRKTLPPLETGHGEPAPNKLVPSHLFLSEACLLVTILSPKNVGLGLNSETQSQSKCEIFMILKK